MRKQYYLEISKQHVADLTAITQLQSLYSRSLSLPIVEFKISEISSFAKEKIQSQFKIYAPNCFQEKPPSTDSSISPPQFWRRKNPKTIYNTSPTRLCNYTSWRNF